MKSVLLTDDATPAVHDEGGVLVDDFCVHVWADSGAAELFVRAQSL